MFLTGKATTLYHTSMDTAQLLLLCVVIILSFLLLILGIQVFLILKELKKTINKINKILDDAAVISESVSLPISNFSGILNGIKTGVSLLSLFKHKKKTNKEEEKNHE